MKSPIEVDIKKNFVYLNGKIVTTFTTYETKLLFRLVSNPDIIFTRDQLLECDPQDKVGLRCIDARIGRIRKKLGEFKKHLQSVYRSGYRYTFNEELAS